VEFDTDGRIVVLDRCWIPRVYLFVTIFQCEGREGRWKYDGFGRLSKIQGFAPLGRRVGVMKKGWGQPER